MIKSEVAEVATQRALCKLFKSARRNKPSKLALVKSSGEIMFMKSYWPILADDQRLRLQGYRLALFDLHEALFTEDREATVTRPAGRYYIDSFTMYSERKP